MNCPDCGVPPGSKHEDECDVERCPSCGRQLVSCDCPEDLVINRLPWTGTWPGEAECREFGWFSKLVPGVGWVACEEDDPAAEPDLSRLFKDAEWSPLEGRFVRRESRG
jgi:hypothetical protein